ncbi:MAG: lipoprotein-releasing system ATP-binding protein LolD [Zetaproteobacteria bacterium CG_4_9_14_3_um_filter_49_83]|nr:MAG: lipoprotein ABC transporter ATP-binding protein [Zetaproteobacteria bacterium CG1_02_49_23]PIQ33482.1 MAG: lipoprotein-releasing system ATP-binding protein LolD [Zetaproteobacteria bacterium CG17_big_fil_post_rev_8_21_14_2_50_50_13]PIV29330.1 MAG: lipoprotein-releasing system ATP-binding protein LolD [Zetaproteobacteria bacterium CG02_land_8_20_14_3_00_50_9]PIY55689.1 MAG: lipoprotein-releasing system ATP-binding protein LolD [Zetaproteobacteria bacterium CG_4_10_14_0_8_um_filter_49_80]
MIRLQVRDLSKSYKTEVEPIHVLRGVSFELEQGQFLAIVGESGSGKSTLLQILGTLDEAESGEALLDGRSVFNLSEREKAGLRNSSIGFVYQAHHLIPELSALENVMLPLLIRGESSKEAAGRAMDLLTRLGLQSRSHHVPAKLSGGEAQRVAVARALVASPKLLLADEPTGNLDEKTAQEVFSQMRLLCQEEQASVIMVTHSMALANATDRVLQLKKGVLI